ncbi:hypothetical protein FNV43_RR23908 [Rhamnella rubrinervis]|uniref:Uncharacterized protein n=1 Tax=Rhamnella rubrinervis TaxID=2594499 RepID=A0A8K0GPR9_9ROSA|nr:hypothetical protein FNV43_RR23908 [Rhamnella rubrinervis]
MTGAEEKKEERSLVEENKRRASGVLRVSFPITHIVYSGNFAQLGLVNALGSPSKICFFLATIPPQETLVSGFELKNLIPLVHPVSYVMEYET